MTPQDFGVSPCTVCAWESNLTVVTQSPCHTAKSNFNASYSWGEPSLLALASNLVCSEVTVEKKLPDSANEGGGSILESPQKTTRYSVWVLGQQASRVFPWRPWEMFSLHWAGSGAWLAASVWVHCRQTGSQPVIPLGLISHLVKKLEIIPLVPLSFTGFFYICLSPFLLSCD